MVVEVVVLVVVLLVVVMTGGLVLFLKTVLVGGLVGLLVENLTGFETPVTLCLISGGGDVVVVILYLGKGLLRAKGLFVVVAAVTVVVVDGWVMT